MTTSVRPPGPDLSRLAALRAFRKDPLGLLERLAAYGDVVRIDVPGSAAYLLNHPDLVHEVLVTEHRSFHKGPTIQAAKMLLGESLLTSEDETHRRQRRLIQPMFHHERIASYAASMVRFAELAADRWSDGEEVDLQTEMAALTLAVVGDTLFGTDVDERRSATVRRALTDTLGMFDRVYSPLFRLLVRLPSPTMRRYRRVESDLNRVIAEMIAERREAGATGDDLLSLLLRAREDGAGMSDEQVRDEALTLFLAGHETTAIALTWTWWLLSQNPEAEARLHAELDATLSGRAPSIEDLPNLPYTQAVVSESIRLRPPAWAIGRTAVADHRANDVPIGGRLDRRGLAVAPAPRSSLVARARGLPARTLARRRDRTSPVRVHPVRRRPARVHRRAVRATRGDDAARDDRSAMAVRERVRPGSRDAGRDHAPAARWAADGRGSPLMRGDGLSRRRTTRARREPRAARGTRRARGRCPEAAG